MTVTGALRCPACGGSVEARASGAEACVRCGREIPTSDGVRLLGGEPTSAATRFYSADDDGRYGRSEMGAKFDVPVRRFLEELPDRALVVEIGAGAGAFNGAHPGYVAADYSLLALKRYTSGERIQLDAQALPFADGSVDAFFSIATLEHVPEPEKALAELDRCLAPAGRLLLYPAWYVRPWAGRALAVRPYPALSWGDRARKASIPLRDSKPYQFARVLPGRIRREIALDRGRRIALSYRRLTPNLSEHVTSDSDAFVSLDPHAVAAYFLSRGYKDLRRSSPRSRLLYGYEPVLVER